MAIHHFDDLLHAAQNQPERQRLLLMFAARELPEGATPAQRARFERGEGGALTPLMCVDKKPEELTSFADLRHETAQQMAVQNLSWDLMFVGALSGVLSAEPTDAEVDQQLNRMLQSLQTGQISTYLAFNTQGEPVQTSIPV